MRAPPSLRTPPHFPQESATLRAQQARHTLCPLPHGRPRRYAGHQFASAQSREAVPKLQMQKTLADVERAITILESGPDPCFPAASTMPIRKPRQAADRPPAAPRRGAAPKTQPAQRSKDIETVAEGFYRDLVWNLRNGVIAVTRDGRIAVMNEVAYRNLGLTPRTTDIGQPFATVLRDRP